MITVDPQSQVDQVEIDSPASTPGRIHRIVTSNVFWGVVLAVLTWPYRPNSLVVRPGLDGSWRTSLAMGVHAGVPVGSHVIFTYGPLGFLQSLQLNYLWTSDLSFLFLALLSAAVCGAYVWSLRRAVPLALSVVVTYIVTAVTLGSGLDAEYLVGLVLIACVAIVNRETTDPPPRWMWISLGGVFVVASLLKVSLCPAIALLLVITLACMPSGRWRALQWIAIGAAVAFCFSWFGTGNNFGNIVPFAKSSAALISGYSSAMAIEQAGRAYVYWLAAAAAILVLSFAWTSRKGLSRRSTIGITALALVAIWVVFKEGFVRHDHLHDEIFFAVAPVLLIAFLPKRRPWALVPGVLAMTALYALVASGHAPLLPRPDAAVNGLGSETNTLLSGARSAAVIGQSRRSLHDTYGLPSQMLTMMRGQTVDVSPWEQTVVWAYPQMHFDPLPVIQDYSAFTSSLDRTDANYLASSDAPQFILREPNRSLDKRDPAFEPPATQLAIECRYHQVASTITWQLLQRGDDRCGPMRSLGVENTGLGHWIPVPTAPPGRAVVAQFQLSLGWLSGVEALAFKPAHVYIQYNGDHKLFYRFITGTSAEPHVLREASTLGYDSRFFRVPVSSLRFSIAGGHHTAQGVEVSFFDVPVAPAPAR